jgi:hypothetical protein
MFVFPTFLHAADLSFSPSSGTYSPGTTFTISVYVTNNSESINGVGGTITFPSDLLSVKSISKDSTIINSWSAEPLFSNTKGTISFEGVIPNGFSSSRGKVITITFLAKSEGLARLNFSSSRVLANDGKTSSVFQNVGSALLTISAPAEQSQTQKQKDPIPISIPSASAGNTKMIITSSVYPKQDNWYNSRNASFQWFLPDNATAVRLAYTDEPFSVPTKVYDPPINRKDFVVDGDGIMYMHVQAKTSSVWGPVSHYKFQIDTQPPENIRLSLAEGEGFDSFDPTIQVSAEDDLSGLGYIDFVIDDKVILPFPVSETNTYTLKGLEPGNHVAVINIKDKAGNTTSAKLPFVVKEIRPPVITYSTRHAIVGDVLKVAGETEPNTTVEVTYTNVKTEQEYNKTLISNWEGKFTMLWEEKLPSGAYEMKARILKEKGVAGSYTAPYAFSIEERPLMQFGVFIMNWISLVLIFILSIALIAAFGWYSFFHVSRFTRGVRRNVRNAEVVLKDKVQTLYRDTEELHSLLAKIKQNRKLTGEEGVMMKRLKMRLDSIEVELVNKLQELD